MNDRSNTIKAGPFKKRFGLGSAKTKDLIFYCLMFAFPVAQFCIFYIGVNVNSFLLAFKTYDRATNSYPFIGGANIRQAFNDLVGNELMSTAAVNSLILYVVGTFVGITLTLFFAFYVYKKMHFAGFYKIILFLPAIISAVVMVLIYRYVVEGIIPEFAYMFTGNRPQGLLSNENTRFGTILFYTIWSGFGVQLLMYSGAMSNISESIVEAAHIEGAGNMREFFSITMPLIYPTLVTYLVVGVAGFFTNQMELYSFYSDTAPNSLMTFGYFLFRETYAIGEARYPYVASLGILMTAVAVPLTFGAKFLLEKLGPKAD